MTESVPRSTRTRAAGVGLLVSLVAGALLALTGSPASAHHLAPVLPPTSVVYIPATPATGNSTIKATWVNDPASGPFDVSALLVDDPATPPRPAPLPTEDFQAIVTSTENTATVEVPRPAPGASKTYQARVCNQRFAFTDAGGVFHPEQDLCTAYQAVTVFAPATPPPPCPGTPGCVPAPFTGWYAPYRTVDHWTRQMFRDFAGREARLDELVFFRGQLEDDRTGPPPGACAPAVDQNALADGDLFGPAGCKAAVIQMEDLRKDHVHPNAAAIIRLYRAYFLRTPDYAGLKYWIERREAGRPLNSISAFFASSREFRTLYGDLDNGEFVAQVYLNVLERPLDSAGYAFWLRQLNSGAMTRGRMMIGFSESPENKSRTVVEVGAVEAQYVMLQAVPSEAELLYLRAIFSTLDATDPPVAYMQYLYRNIILRDDYRARVGVNLGF